MEWAQLSWSSFGHSLALPGWVATARTSPSPHSSATARVSGAKRCMISGGKHALPGCWGLKRSSSILLCLSVGIHGIAACTRASLRRRATLGPATAKQCKLVLGIRTES